MMVYWVGSPGMMLSMPTTDITVAMDDRKRILDSADNPELAESVVQLVRDDCTVEAFERYRENYMESCYISTSDACKAEAVQLQGAGHGST